MSFQTKMTWTTPARCLFPGTSIPSSVGPSLHWPSHTGGLRMWRDWGAGSQVAVTMVGMTHLGVSFGGQLLY